MTRGRHNPGAPIVVRAYDLCAVLYTHVNRFPRAQRTLLGRLILDEALRMMAALTLANRLADKRGALEEASGRLDALRIALRLAKRLAYLPNRAYAHLSETIDEVGRMLGGWLKHESDPLVANCQDWQSRPEGRSYRLDCRQDVTESRIEMKNMNMKVAVLFSACAAALFALTATAAETENHPSGFGPGELFEINWRKIASGGTLSSGGGAWALAGTIGQHDDTGRNELQGGPWSLTGGFWAPGFQIDSQGVIFRDRFED